MSDTVFTIASQVSAGNVIVTPTGGAPDTLANILGKSGSANTIVAGQGRTITRSTGAASNADFAIRQSAVYAGTASSVPFVNYFSTDGDSMDCTSSSSAGAGVGGNTFIRHNFGTNARGCRYALQAWAVQMNTTGNTSDAAYVGGQFSFFGNANDGGTAPLSGSSRGNGFGINAQALLSPGATNWSGLFGAEVDISAEAGSSVRQVTGVLVSLKNDHASHGAEHTDAAFQINVGYSATTAFDYAFVIGKAGQPLPIVPTGTFIASPAGGSAANGIDFSATSFSGAAFKSKGFSVDGAGNIMSSPLISLNFANDAAAAAGGVKVGSLYHDNGVVRVRLI